MVVLKSEIRSDATRKKLLRITSVELLCPSDSQYYMTDHSNDAAEMMCVLCDNLMKQRPKSAPVQFI